jgi:hypothetical protein
LVAVPIALTLAAVGSFRHATAGQDTTDITIGFTPDPPIAGQSTEITVKVCSLGPDVLTDGKVTLTVDSTPLVFPVSGWTQTPPTSTTEGCATWTFTKTGGFTEGPHTVSAIFAPMRLVDADTDSDHTGETEFEVIAATLTSS